MVPCDVGTTLQTPHHHHHSHVQAKRMQRARVLCVAPDKISGQVSPHHGPESVASHKVIVPPVQQKELSFFNPAAPLEAQKADNIHAMDCIQKGKPRETGHAAPSDGSYVMARTVGGFFYLRRIASLEKMAANATIVSGEHQVLKLVGVGQARGRRASFWCRPPSILHLRCFDKGFCAWKGKRSDSPPKDEQVTHACVKRWNTHSPDTECHSRVVTSPGVETMRTRVCVSKLHSSMERCRKKTANSRLLLDTRIPRRNVVSFSDTCSETKGTHSITPPPKHCLSHTDKSAYTEVLALKHPHVLKVTCIHKEK